MKTFYRHRDDVASHRGVAPGSTRNLAQDRAFTRSALFGLLLVAVACGDASMTGVAHDGSTIDAEEVSTTLSAVSGVVNFPSDFPSRTCTQARQQRIRAGVRYLANRVLKERLVLRDCLHQAYLRWYDGNKADKIAAVLGEFHITDAYCADLDDNVNAQAALDISGEVLTLDNSFIDGSTVRRLASVIAHEVLHNRGYTHPSSATSFYSNTVNEQAEACILNWVGNAATDVGYALHRDGSKSEDGPTLSRTDAIDACNEDRARNPGSFHECFFNGTRIGYELYRNGIRVGFDPRRSETSALNNCSWNLMNRAQFRHECFFDGKGIGYELYRNGRRAGYEPSWSKANAVNNCDWNVRNRGRYKHECIYNGERIGYELYRSGVRAGFEPSWTKDQAIANCNWNRTNRPDLTHDCLFEGVPL